MCVCVCVQTALSDITYQQAPIEHVTNQQWEYKVANRTFRYHIPANTNRARDQSTVDFEPRVEAATHSMRSNERARISACAQAQAATNIRSKERITT